ncbi:2-alkenal reductase (NADP(+)-dependent)-like [Carica papaya]|uniref:2-alkenal reductase (NADP(+)-dependent)-like n=1 Tax=Carica papaya TaxID=3649 RepID=UPI000B8C7840|nr:2-alkenal reductase (NADP(+)-dependent)-like [Carica papaya]
MAKSILESREWYMAAYVPQGLPTSDHIKLRSVPFSLAADSIPDNHVAIELLFISIDPYLRGRMVGHEDGLYFPQFKLNEVITAVGVGRVIGSKDEKFKEGDVLFDFSLPVAEYSVVPTDSMSMRKLDLDSGIPLPEYLSALGLPGFAAWVGIGLVGEVKPGSNVFISAAAGGVGMYAGQLAKLKGCRVVGSTGSDEKVRLLKEEFGYDDAFNYRTESDFDACLTNKKVYP